MTQPTPPPTQTLHPWRAVIRTIVAVALPLLPALPELANVLGVATVPIVAAILAGAAAITRILALPQVQAALHKTRATAWLAATPPPTPIAPVSSGGEPTGTPAGD